MQNKTNLKFILAAAILSTSTVSTANDISYDYIQGTYASLTIDTDTSEGDLDGNGFGVSGSFSIAPNFAITASYASTSLDEFLGIDIDTTELTFGVTGHTSIAPGTDIVGNFSILKAEIELSDGFDSIDDDDTGNVISVGLRHRATEAIELELGVSRVDVFEDSENVISVGARFYANEKFSLGIAYANSDDVDTFLFNARFDIK